MQTLSPVLREARRIVIKVGSSLVTNEGRGLDEQVVGQWCRQMAALVREGLRVVALLQGDHVRGQLDGHHGQEIFIVHGFGE